MRLKYTSYLSYAAEGALSISDSFFIRVSDVQTSTFGLKSSRQTLATREGRHGVVQAVAARGQGPAAGVEFSEDFRR